MRNKNLYQTVTDSIVSALEEADPQDIPWRKSWSGSFMPRNGHSGRMYRGINVPYLWSVALNRGYDSNQWFTYNGARAAGGHVKRGEKSQADVIYWKLMKKDKNIPDSKAFPLIRSYAVFNEAQCEGIETIAALSDTMHTKRQAEALLAIHACDAQHREGEPCYIPSADTIEMPPEDAFWNTNRYLATYFHELSHWTGHEKRLDRKFIHRAEEELIAELGSCYCCAYFDLLDAKNESDAVKYLDSWVKAMKEDNRYIFKAARNGFEAANYILGNPDELSAEEKPETSMTVTRQ